MKKAVTTALMLICLMTLSMVLDEPIRVHAQTNVATSAVITVEPNQVEVNDSVVINIQIDPPPPGSTDRFNNISITFTSSNGTTTTGLYNISTSSGTGNDNFAYTPTLTGTWTLTVSFLGQTFDNGEYYMPSENETTFTVIPNPLPTETPSPTQYQGDITINADGSVSPSTAPIQQVGNIYTLASDVTGSITVNGNNMVLDGNRHTIIYGGSGPGNVFALSLNDVSNVTVANFTVTGGWFGIAFWGSSCVIANNTITGTGNGIYAIDEPTAGLGVTGDSNNITGNTLINNYDGIVFYAGENNLVVGNTIEYSSNPYGESSYGLIFWGASNNTIYHNNFENNAEQAGDASDDSALPVNVWDDGYPGGGNYWSDYQTRYPKATEIDSSRIADTPYVIDAQNKDQYPLMYAFNEYYVLQATPPKVSLLSPLNQTYNESNVSLVFAVDKTVNWIGYSLDGEQNVTITGNSTIANMTNGLHSITVYANDTFGDFGVSENATFSIALAPLVKPEPFPTATVATVSGASAVIVVGAGLFIYFKKRKRQA